MSLNLEGKRLAVVGSRNFDDKQKLYEILTKNLSRIKLIVSGGARGADTLATEWAADYGVPYLVFPARWRDPETGQHDRGAGYRRNRHIVQYSDVVMAFWDGESRGTEHTINMATEAGKPVKIIHFTPPPPKKPEEVDIVHGLVGAKPTGEVILSTLKPCNLHEQVEAGDVGQDDDPPECTCHLAEAEAAEAEAEMQAAATEIFNKVAEDQPQPKLPTPQELLDDSDTL